MPKPFSLSVVTARTMFLLWFAGMILPALAQKKSRFQQFSIEDGLSQNTINTIFQDSKGFMWFGTQNGLNRYDGVSFTVYKSISGDTNTIASSDVYAVFEDRHKNIWFGTRSGLSRYNRASNNFSNFEDDALSLFAMRPVWCIVGDHKEDKLWIGASGGLFQFDIATKQFNHYKINDSIQNANSIRTICEDRTGKLWIGPTVGGLKLFDKTKRIFTAVNSPSDNLLRDITCIHEDKDGLIWMGKEDGSILRYNHINNTFQEYNALKNKFPIRALLQDKEGNLWIGTDKGGVFLLNESNGRMSMLGEKDQNGTDVVLSFFNDAKGDMWLGTYHGGAYLFDKVDTTFNHLSPYPEIKHPEESNSVLAIYDDGKDLWLGTDGGGLVRKGGATTQYYKKSTGNAIAGNTILCITAGKDDQLYAGTYADGFSILDRKSGRFRNYNTSNGLNDNSVWTIYSDGDVLWIGTNKGGINLFNTRTKTFKYFTNILKDERTISSNTIRCIYKDTRGKVWIGTVSGLNLFNEQDSTFTSFFNRSPGNSLSNVNVLCIYEDARKNLWMGTHGGGINKYDYHTDTFTSFQEKDGLAGNIVYSILEDAQGNLWMSTNKGISKFDVAKKEFKNFDTRSGLASSQFNVGSYYKRKDGRMYFGNIEGVSAFYPHFIRQNSFVPPVVITEFHLFNKPVSIGGESPLTKAIEETSEITLDYTQSVFSLRFAALNYTHSDKNNFQYKLEPFDKEWIYAGNSNTATYTNLDPGSYVFKVKGSNNDGVWNEKFTTLKITITPPFWKTIWFNVLLTVLAVVVLYGAYRLKIRSMKKQKEILTLLVDQRTKEIEEKNKLLLETEKKNAHLLHQKLNDELSLKSKELTNYALLIIQKNRLLDELKKKLKDVVRNPGSSNLRDFRNLVQMINYNFSPEKEWKEFNVNFNRVHEGFTDSLKSRFPELTSNDLRLCALYRTGIPTKDIAEAMGISQTSVKMARYRLRKKLSLSPEEDIHEFLLKVQ
jgi:ligand-binding sensor domain-containing protein